MILKKIQGVGVRLQFSNSTPNNVIQIGDGVSASTKDGIMTLTGKGVVAVSVSAMYIEGGDFTVPIADEKSKSETTLWAIDFLGDEQNFVIKD